MILTGKEQLKALRYILRELKNICEFYLIPLLVVFLPRQLFYPLFKFICTHTLFYKKYSHDSLKKAQSILPKTPENTNWDRNVRLLHLMDIADLWLSVFRPKKIYKLMTKNNNWNNEKGFIALSCHWGLGYMSLFDLKKSQLSPFLVFFHKPVDFVFQGYIENVYRKFRRKIINRITGNQAIQTGGGYQLIKNRIANKDTAIIVFDTPKKHDAKYSLQFNNYHFDISSGSISLICNENIPYQFFSIKLDFETGMRELRISELKTCNDENELLAQMNHFFEELISQDPEHWYFWRHSHNMFKKNDK